MDNLSSNEMYSIRFGGKFATLYTKALNGYSNILVETSPSR